MVHNDEPRQTTHNSEIEKPNSPSLKQKSKPKPKKPKASKSKKVQNELFKNEAQSPKTPPIQNTPTKIVTPNVNKDLERKMNKYIEFINARN